MGLMVPELRELSEGMITNLQKDKVFMGDVHSGNIGRVNGHWVVVDPGHIAVLTDDAP
jgi:streptomycin 6-kinase